MSVNSIAVFVVIFFAGSVVFDASSQSVSLGSFSRTNHQVRGDLYAIDEKTIRIENFRYDGTGVSVFLYVFRRSGGGGIVVNWSLFESEIPRRRFGFNGREDFTISLLFNRPNLDLLASELSSITIWCEPFNAFFGRLENIPASTLPPGPQMVYCIQLHNNLQVTIGYNEDTIRIRQCGCIEEDQYMAFGISGSTTSTNMVGADVVVTWINDDGPNAVDYYLTSRQQCRGGVGVCPDTLLASGTGTQDTTIVTADVTNNRRCIEYSRPLGTDDPHDRSFLINNQSQYIVWAYGPRATEEGLRDLAFFHLEYPRDGANFLLNFAASSPGGNSLSCPSELSCSTRPVCQGWTGIALNATESTVFTVKLGLSGGIRGYQSITGLSGWGIAYYINDTLIPVLRLRRNVTYTFIVEAGDDPNDGPNYHPFYITDSEDGGILLDTPEDRMRKNETVFAGYDLDTNQPTAAGRLCEHVETDDSAAVAEDCDSELQEYLDTLDVTCQGDESEAAILTWTPDDETPNYVFYQCANHIHLGWRIELEPNIPGLDPTSSVPDEPVTSPDEPTGSVPVTSPDEPTSSEPDEPVTSPDEPTGSVTDESVTDEPTLSGQNNNSGNQVKMSHLITWLFLLLTLTSLC